MMEEKEGVNPIVVTVLMAVITIALGATVYIMVSNYGGVGTLSSAPSAQVGVPTYPKSVEIYATLDYHKSTYSYDMSYNSTYKYVISYTKTMYLSLPNKNVEDVHLVVDGVEMIPDVSNYKIKITLEEGTHTVTLRYKVEDISSFKIDLPYEKFIEKLYVKVIIRGTQENMLSESSLPPDNTYKGQNSISYVWVKNHAILNQDILIESKQPTNDLDSLPSVIALVILSNGIFLIILGYLKDKISVEFSYMCFLAPIIGSLLTADVSLILGILIGTTIGVVSVILLYLFTIKKNRSILIAGIVISIVPLSLVLQYGAIIAISTVLVFIIIIGIMVERKYSSESHLRTIIKEKKELEQRFSRLKELSEKIVSEYRAENSELQRRLREIEEEKRKLEESLAKIQKGFTRNYCPRCGKEIKEDFAFCPYCSAKLEFIGKCEHCGSLVTQDMTFCPNCGHALKS